ALSGRCHCGNLSFTLRPGGAAEELRARRCGCSFCRGRRLRWTSDPAGAVEIAVADADLLSRYRFGTGTADFLICRRCGQVVAALTADEPAPRAVINVDALDAPDVVADVDAQASDFDGEEVAARRARRARSWTPARLLVAGATSG
ncbi:MAG: hypothetical protein KC486_30680, partial [Myxococcales bacterium]|nr:hypothetical protein [Myxococcales bacterium]